MGGSGGSGYTGMSPEYQQRLAASQEKERSTLNERIDQFLAEMLASANALDRDLMRRRLDVIQRHLSDALEVEQLMFGGSVAKRTAVDGISDVDALVLLDRYPALSRPPRELLVVFAQELRTRLSANDVDSVTSGSMAVTVKFRDGMEMQLLPAIRRGEDVMIGRPDGSAWREIAPRAFRDALSAANQKVGGNLVPVVKLFKAINDRQPPQKQLSGYHIEALAIEAVKGYDGSCNTRVLLGRFLESASQRVLSGISDMTRQSRFVDDDLGQNNSIERRNIAQTLMSLKRRLDAASSIGEWKAVFGE